MIELSSKERPSAPTAARWVNFQSTFMRNYAHPVSFDI